MDVNSASRELLWIQSLSLNARNENIVNSFYKMKGYYVADFEYSSALLDISVDYRMSVGQISGLARILAVINCKLNQTIKWDN
jgi:hypothetical protein